MQLGLYQSYGFPKLLYRIVDQIKGFNWLNYGGGKFSTSLNRGVFTDEALDLFSADYWRYILLFMATESNDSDFTFQQAVSLINKDLADTLGNFVSCVYGIINKNFPDGWPEGFSLDESLADEVLSTANSFKDNMSALNFRKSMQELRRLWAIGNEYVAKT